MTSLIYNDINRYLQANSNTSFDVLESALIGAVLDSSKIYKVRNDDIQDVLAIKTPQREMAYSWIKAFVLNPSLQHLLILYEVSVSAENRKFDGAYFTPDKIVNAIVDLTVGRKIGSICDPACGSGAFLLGSLKKLLLNKAGTIQEILSEHIWGIDINNENVEHSKRILSLFAILEGVDEKHFNIGIFQGNSLDFSWVKTSRKKAEFDFIVGNPPYVRGKHLTASLKAQIKSWPSANGGIADLYIPFFEIALSWIKNNSGRVGYITPNTYFSSINGRGVRKMITVEQILEKVIDLKGFPAFEGLLTYTCVTILDKAGVKKPLIGAALTELELDDIRKIKLSEVDYVELGDGDWYIRSKDIISDMRRIESVGIPLTSYVLRFTTGIATLRNDLYIFNLPVNNGFINHEIDGKKFNIEEGALVSIIKPNKIKDTVKLKKNKEKAIYPYKISVSGGRIVPIPESEFKKSYPGAYEYLQHIKPELENRSCDNSASEWYAYGRSQALNGFGKKIIFPMMSDRPVFLWVDDPNTLIYCGYALYPKSSEDAEILLKILNSSVFWYYLSNTSKNYAGGYKSFAKNYVKKFSIPHLDKEQKKFLLSLPTEKINHYLFDLYGLQDRQLTRSE